MIPRQKVSDNRVTDVGIERRCRVEQRPLEEIIEERAPLGRPIREFAQAPVGPFKDFAQGFDRPGLSEPPKQLPHVIDSCHGIVGCMPVRIGRSIGSLHFA
jgi:hypothetical protein